MSATCELKRTTLCFVAAVLAFAATGEASFINYAAREINVKIVYAGPSTHHNLEILNRVYRSLESEVKGKKISLDTETASYHFFDYLPEVPEIRGFKLRVHLYTLGGVPGEADRRLLLKGVDGVIFVADGDPRHLSETLASWTSLQGNIRELGYAWSETPMALQLLDESVGRALTPRELNKRLSLGREPIVPGDLAEGDGIQEAIDEVVADLRRLLSGQAIDR